jgi:uncharacterized protein YecA (UPF0149 family)
MALSLSEQIASIQDQVNRLKELLKEQEQGQKQQTFHITFEYKTNADAWPAVTTLDEARIREQILTRLCEVTEALEFDDQGEQFNLMTVARVATAP